MDSAAGFSEPDCRGELFQKYIPDFQHYLLPLRDYSYKELIGNQGEVSLVMMINKLQTAEDVENFSQISPEELESILKDISDYLVKTIADVILVFLLKTNVSEENVKIDFLAAEKRAVTAEKGV